MPDGVELVADEQRQQVVDLGAQPCAERLPTADTPGPDPRWPLELWLCRDCTLVQLGPVEPQLPEPPLAVESATSIAHAESSVKELLRDYPELAGGVVFEFASHHGGSWLEHLYAEGCRLAGAVNGPTWWSTSTASPTSRRSAS